jgi:hypothetical protein
MDIANCSKKTANVSMASLAKRNGIPMDMMAEIWRSYCLSKGMMTVVSRAPEFAEEAIESAKSTNICCPRCDGEGEVESRKSPGDWNPCPQCEGKRVIRKSGDANSRKILFDTVGWTGKTGPQVQVNIGGGHSLESVMSGIDNLLERSGDMGGPIVDVK